MKSSSIIFLHHYTFLRGESGMKVVKKRFLVSTVLLAFFFWGAADADLPRAAAEEVWPVSEPLFK
jgi:hypothetical protein